MTDPADAAAAVLLLFFGVGILLAVNVALYGGNINRITEVITALAGPIVVVAILVFFAVAVFNAVAGS